MSYIQKFKDKQALADFCSTFLLEKLIYIQKIKDKVHIILSGGTGPVETYKQFADKIRFNYINIKNINWFFGDERWVPDTDAQSNERMCRETLLSTIAVDDSNVFSWKACLSTPYKAAIQYNEMVKANIVSKQETPDILLLGMGADGHTASLFPGSIYLMDETTKIPVDTAVKKEAIAVYAEKLKAWRLSLSSRFLNQSRYIIFIISGADKKEAFKEVCAGNPLYPASWIQGKELYYFVTEDVVD